ncbi:MAG: hypothetical protein HY813_01320 [Candidatus Portnoybacteria bacterium]|nr:hypothetical protein [Candidatus Portnoybacteria bacterium]
MIPKLVSLALESGKRLNWSKVFWFVLPARFVKAPARRAYAGIQTDLRQDGVSGFRLPPSPRLWRAGKAGMTTLPSLN